MTTSGSQRKSILVSFKGYNESHYFFSEPQDDAMGVLFLGNRQRNADGLSLETTIAARFLISKRLRQVSCDSDEGLD